MVTMWCWLTATGYYQLNIIVIFIIIIYWCHVFQHNYVVSTESIVVMGDTMGTGTFKPEKNLEFFRLKSPGTYRCLHW